MIDDLNQLTRWTLLFGVVCISLCRLITGRWFTPATWYWVVWVGCLASYSYVLGLDTLPEPEPLTISVLTDAHSGAFYGFVGFAVLSRLVTRGRTPVGTQSSPLAYLDGIHTKKIDRLLGLYLLVAVALLVYRIATVGKVDLAFLQAARDSFIGQDKTAIRPLLLMVPISVPLTIILSARLASGTIQLQRPLILFAICFITAMADASRIKLLTVLALGMLMLTTVIDEEGGERVKALVSRYWLAAVSSIVLLIGLLQVIQIIRATGSIEVLLDDPLLVFLPTNLMAYLAQGTSAMALFYEAANGPVGGGDLTFAFPLKYGAMLGLNDVPVSKGDIYAHVLHALDDHRVHRGGISGIGILLTDFGPENIWAACFWMAGALQLLFVACINRGFVGRSLAVCCCMGALFTVLNIWFLSAAMMLGLVWCMVVGRWLNLPLWTDDPHRATLSGPG